MRPSKAAVMAAIRDLTDDPPTTAEIAARTGYSGATVRSATSQLAYEGFILQHRNTWRLTRAGQTFAASKRGQNVLDVPAHADV